MAGKKQRDNAAADAEMKAKKDAKGSTGESKEETTEQGQAAEPVDILTADGDEDIIF